jgi:putative transposase
VFNKIFAGLAAKAGKAGPLMIDATHLKAHRTAASLLKKGACCNDSPDHFAALPDVSGAPKPVLSEVEGVG